MSRARIAVLSALVWPACQLPPSSAVDEPVSAAPHSEGRGILLSRLVSWPAGGAELTVRLETSDGVPMTGDRSSELEFRWAGVTQPAPISVRREAPQVADQPGHTLVLVLPGTSAQAQEALASALSSFIASRRAGERVALYRWGERVDQLANFTTDRDAVDQALSRMPIRDPAATMRAPGRALGDAVFEVRRVDNDVGRGVRRVVIVGHDVPGPAPDGNGQTVVVHWVIERLESRDIDALGAGRALRWDDHGGLAGALAEADARTENFHESLYTIALCGVDGGVREATVTVAGQPDPYLNVLMPGSVPEDRVGECDPARILAGERSYPDAIEFEFTAEQRAAYDALAAANSKDEFDLAVRFWPDGPLVKARAHLRGKGSIGCARRNYTLNLDGNQGRYLLPDSATDEFYIISMCLDDRYVRAHTVYDLLGQFGLFPSRFRYVELRLDGRSRGAYLLIEKVKETLVQDNGRVRAVIRRRYNPDMTIPDIAYASAGEASARALYHDLLSGLSGLSGEPLAQALDDSLDVSGYLSLLAINTLLHNGDNVDEVWMMSTERVRSDGAVGDWYSFYGWDPDDIFAGCHYSGQFAYQDAFGLIYCAEAELDDIILDDPDMYRRYVDQLEQVILAMTDEVFQAALDRTAASLLPYIRQPEIAAAMVELIEDVPSASDPSVAEAEITAALADLRARFQSRRQVLLQRIAAYRMQTGF